MTEDEAKTKVCCGPPAVAVAQLAAPGGEDANISCVGSACMAWRWGYVRHLDEGLVQVVNDGYCGLAGAPR